MSDKEKEVFDQEINPEEMKAATGGEIDKDGVNCIQELYRNIYERKPFPNCPATMESRRCHDNDGR